MNFRFASSSRAATLSVVAGLGALAPILTPVSHAAPKPQLQIWPDRRVLLVLPLQVSPTWNADPQLGQAILPLAQPQLQQALTGTGKFSLTLPYRFDPVLRRGLTEKQLAENDITAFQAAPTLASSRPVIDKLNFDQPVMTTEVFLEELTIGGTAKKPTVQIQVSGKLYQQGAFNETGARDAPILVKTESYRSQAATGRTPSDRLIAAAKDAFNGLAAAFVEPPAAFDLPAPIEVAPVKADARSGANATASTGSGASSASAATSTPPPAAPPAALPSTATPNALPATPGAPLVPQLPAAQPPLGVTAGQDTTTGR